MRPGWFIAVSGVLIGLGGAWVWRWADLGQTATLAAGVVTLVGGALFLGGVLTQLFIRAAMEKFEWFVAWRYLGTRKRSWVALITGIVTVFAGGALLAVALWVKPGELIGPGLGGSLHRQLMAAAAVIWLVSSWILFFGVLTLHFSIFTSISIIGVFLGSFVLVVVLSVMGGFEQDLRRKILGARAHIVVTKPKGGFRDHRRTLQHVRQLRGVRAAAPYLEGEVMVTSQSNLSGVLLRGIDPAQTETVTDLRRYLRVDGGAGRLDDLTHPERLLKVQSIPAGLPSLATRPKAKEISSSKGAAEPAKRGTVSAKTRRNRLEATAKTAPLGGTPKKLGVLSEQQVRPVYPGIIVGAELARNLRLYLGDDVNIVSPLGGMSPAGPIPKARPFRVAGIFYSGMYEYDTKYAYVLLAEAQRFLGLADEISGIEVKVQSTPTAPSLAVQLQEQLGVEYLVRDWRQSNRNLFSALKLEKIVMFVVLCFIVVVAAFAIVITLTMIVLQKTREIGALKAAGASHQRLLRVFMYAGLYIGTIGMIVGVVEAAVVCFLLKHVGLPLDPEVYYIDRLPVRIDPVELCFVALAAVVLSFAATIHPALMAARLKPVQALRYE